MKKKYSVKELASILGCSVTAVGKKIKPDPDNPVIKRYRNVFETVVENGVTYILLSDEDIEDEKSRSKGFNNIANKGYNTPQNEDIIEEEAEKTENIEQRLFEFTERYINGLTTMQETFYEKMQEKDRQIFLLTTSENQKENEYLATKALNTTLTTQNNVLMQRNNVLKLILAVIATLLITLTITFITIYFNVSNVKKETPAPVEVQEVTNVQTTVQQPVKPTKKK